MCVSINVGGHGDDLSKKGEVMAFVTLTDESASLDMAVMPRQFARYQDLLVKNNYLLFEAKKDRPDSCILQSCRKIEM